MKQESEDRKTEKMLAKVTELDKMLRGGKKEEEERERTFWQVSS